MPRLLALVRHDYAGFARQLLRERKQACLPPFAYQALLTAEHRELARALEFLGAARPGRPWPKPRACRCNCTIRCP